MDDFKEINSGLIRAVSHDAVNETLTIYFHQGRRYEYSGVSAHIHEEMMAADSKGGYFHKWIKPYFRGEEVTED